MSKKIRQIGVKVTESEDSQVARLRELFHINSDTTVFTTFLKAAESKSPVELREFLYGGTQAQASHSEN